MDLDLIKLNVKANSSEDVIRLLGKEMKKKDYVKSGYIDAVLAREAILPTGLNLNDFGVAIPHTDTQYVNKASIGVAVLSKPIKFNNMINPKEKIQVQLVFLLAIQDPSNQVQLLQKLMAVFQNIDLLKLIQKATTKEEIANKLQHIF